MNATDYVKQVLAERGQVRQVYWVACGGSVIDLYPAHCLLGATSTSIESGIFTAAEFNTFPPAKLGEGSLVVTCSHSGGTPETLAACKLAKERGAYVIGMTNRAGTAIDSGSWPCWVYEWEDDTPQAERPAAFSLTIAAELMSAQDGYEGGALLSAEVEKLDAIIREAIPRVERDLGPRFVELCRKHDFFYVLGSGPTFCQTYGFAICSLMEMQWQHCSYVSSAEYFHGPFECTEDGVFYFLQKGAGANRAMDERAERFLEGHTDTYMVLDSAAYGMDEIDESVRSYLDPIFFYEMNVALRGVRGRAFDHDPDVRRYMGIEKY